MIYSAPRNGREATPHWQAARRGKLLLPFDPATQHPVWPPSPAAVGGTIEWREIDGGGAVVSFSVVRRPVQPEWKDQAPYIVAMIQLDAGPILLSNVLDCDPAALRIGARVRACFVETTDPELGLVAFKPDAGSPAQRDGTGQP